LGFERKPRLKALRSVLAVIAGYLIFAVCSFALFRFSGHDPYAEATLPFKAFVIGTGVALAAAGGFIASVIARRNPLAHGAALGFLIALFATISLRSLPPSGHGWTQVAAIVAMAPAAVLGSALSPSQR
jgi:hypothetical protein